MVELLDIILIEDSPVDIELTLDAFKENHIANRVKVLRDGEEAVEYIFRTGRYKNGGICDNPKLILLDINLPKIDGFEIFKRLKSDERTKTIPVVIMTSSQIDEEHLEKLKLVADGYVKKPIDFEHFAETGVKLGFYWALLKNPPL